LYNIKAACFALQRMQLALIGNCWKSTIWGASLLAPWIVTIFQTLHKQRTSRRIRSR